MMNPLAQSEFYRCDENLPRGKDCFLHPIATDLALNGKKIAGGAQKRSSGAMLHQESLQFPNGVETQALQAKLSEGFEEVFQIKLKGLDLAPELLQEAGRLAKEKYHERT